MLEYVLTQNNLNKGLKLYGKQGEHTMRNELRQLHDMTTDEEKQKAIATLTFLSEKHDGTIETIYCKS